MIGKLNKPKVVGIGEVVFDILPESRKLGGAPGDFLNYAVKAGAEGFLISAIGADDLGREVVSELKKFDITPVLAITPYPTGRVLIFNTPSGGHTAHILENAAWDYIPLTGDAEQCIKNADAVYFGTLALRKAYSKDTIFDLIDSAPERAYKFFDVNFRQDYYDRDKVRKLLERSNILKCNSDELKIIKTMFKLSGAAEDVCLKLKEMFELRYVIYSDAARESKIWGEEGLSVVKNSRLHQTFAAGAGNAFAGTFVTALLNGMGQKEAHEAANSEAAEVCRVQRGKL